MHLVQLLLPVYDNAGQPFEQARYSPVRQTLTERFGGVTAYLRAPALGAWKDDDEAAVARDDVVTIEVMVDALDRAWWAQWRAQLEQALQQKEIVVRASAIERL